MESSRNTVSIPRPTERALRPASASAKLQSHPSFYTPIVGSKTRAPSAHVSFGVRGRKSALDYGPSAESENFKGDVNLRRSTVSGVEHSLGNDVKLPVTDLAAGDDSYKTKVEEFVTIDILKKLLMAFLNNRQSRYGEGRLSKEEFRDILKEQLAVSGIKASHIVAFFEKIDWPNSGYIGWSDFCTYMQLQYSQREELYVKEKSVHLILPAKSRIAPHREDVIKIIDIGDNLLLSCGKDGYVCFWSATNLELRRHKDLISSSSPMAFKKTRARAKWSTDACVLFEYNKLCIATGDRELLFYELSSLTPYCQVAKLPGIPISVSFSIRGNSSKQHQASSSVEGLIIFGDTNGHVHIISLTNPGEFLRTWKKAKPVEAGGMPTTPFDDVYTSPNCQYICWAIHNDWAHTIYHWKELDQIVSASNDSNNSIVVGCVFSLTNVNAMREGIAGKKNAWSYQASQRPSDQQMVIKIHKGVKTFTVSRRFNYIISGGMDRCVRLWNPFSPNSPSGILRGHLAPIIAISVDDSDARIFSFSQDKFLRIWNLTDHTCLMTVKTKSHKIMGDLQVAAYSPSSKVIAMATDRISIIPVYTRSAVHLEVATTHREPVTCCLYNPVFNHVVTCSDGSVVCVWDLDTGGLVFEFGEAHGDQGITSACFDVTWRRLVTGGRDGVANIWNYNNGHRLKILVPHIITPKSAPTSKSAARSSSFLYTPAPSAKGKVKILGEVCAVSFVELNNNRFVITTGWDRRINVFQENDAPEKEAELQGPSFRWDDDIDHGHTDDILSSAQCPPNWLATGGFNGQLIIWNMISGHQLANCDPPDESMAKSSNPATVSDEQSLVDASGSDTSSEFESSTISSESDSSFNGENDTTRATTRNMTARQLTTIEEQVQSDTAIRKILFIPKRISHKNEDAGAQLVAAGPHGCIHFWSIYHGGKVMARVTGSALKDGVATAIALNETDDCLFTGDSFGFIYKWNIENYARSPLFEWESPELRCFFRCHTEAITSITFISKHQVLLTSSIDCTVRMWDLSGGYIGTFGQQNPWDIRNPSTFRRPHVPYDVLIDPLSVPGPNGIIDGTISDPKDRVTLVEVLAEMKAEHKQMKQDALAEVWSRGIAKLSTDEEIEEELNQRCYSAGTGKRLRHERQKIISRRWMGPSHYQSLRCYDLESGPSGEDVADAIADSDLRKLKDKV